MNDTNGAVTFNLHEQNLILLPQKAIYWMDWNLLLVADVHLGKTGHFRKAGIAVPRDMEQNDLAVLSDLIADLQPKGIIFLGDLFHSDINADWQWLAMWRQQHSHVEMTLIKGNHDIIDEKHYHDIAINVCDEMYIGPFLLLHEPLPVTLLNQCKSYILCGHIHPGVALIGKGRQRITLPCFSFSKKQGILPSFGLFTGKVALRNQQNDHLFGILKNKVIEIK